MRLLTVLAKAGGEVVPADHLLNAVWPGLIVTPSSLYDAVAQLRKVLGADHIATVPRKGYRLATVVAPHASSVAATTVAPEAAPPIAGNTVTVPAEAAEPRLGTRSVAVLPFLMRGLPEPLSFLSESLTGALISELSRQPGLAVVALGTMLTFGQQHPPPQMLAGDLGVRLRGGWPARTARRHTARWRSGGRWPARHANLGR
jgi:DNA-binding winged helix-turn-helix (wHTH) protein